MHTMNPKPLPMLLCLCLLLTFTPVSAQVSPTPANPAAPLAAQWFSTSRSYASGPLVPPNVGMGPGSIDNSTATTEFTVLPGDFTPGSVVETTTIDISFSKVGGSNCPGPGGGDDWAEELRFRLFAPTGASVTLVNYDYHFSNPDVGPVTVTFDDAAPTSVAGLPIQNGIFRPSVGALANFVGLDPAANGGVWILELTDSVTQDPLCFTSATLHITAQEPHDLSITQTDAPDPVYAGELLTYQVAVHNAGPGDAPGTVITDTLPATLEYLADTGGCTLGAGALVCPLGDIPAGGSRVIQVLARVPADAVAATPNGLVTLVNTVTATSTSLVPDVNPADNTAAEATFVTESADLRATKLSQPHDTVAAGEVFTYTLFVDNSGPAFARSVTLTDTLLSSDNFTLLDIVDDPNRADSCALTPTPGGTLISCSLTGPLETPGYAPANGRWQVQFRVRADEAQALANTVAVHAATPDPDLANNQALAFVSVTAVADLAVNLPPLSAFTAGQTTTVYAGIHNAGPSTAHNVTFIDALPAGMTLLTLLHPGMACSQAGAGPTTLTCGAGELAPGASRALTLTVAIAPDLPDGALLIHSAQVSSDDFDAANADNYASVSGLVASTATLNVVKNSTPTALAAGETLAYTIAATNAGPSTAHGVSLVDALPAEVEALSAAGPGGSVCQLRADRVACDLGALAPGALAQVVIHARARADAVPPADPDGALRVTNQVVVSATNAPGAVAGAVTTVNRVSDLALEAAASPAVAYAGEQVHYTLTVANNGPSDAVALVLTDTLPAALTYQTDTGGCALIGSAPDVLRCEPGNLPAGTTRVIHIYARVRADAAPQTTAVHQALVACAPTDPDANNNNATTSTPLLGLADLRVTQYGQPVSQVRAGERLTYTVIVDNLGPGYAHDVSLDAALVSGGAFELLSVTPDRPAACAPLTGTFDQALALNCALTAPLEAASGGDTGRWNIQIVVRATEAQSLHHTAQAFGSDADPNPANNTASVAHEITDVANLAIGKALVGQVQVAGQPGGVFTELPDRVTAGAVMTYTLTVTNAGPSPAQNVVVQDRLPGWLTAHTVTPSQGQCQCTNGVPGDAAAPLICGLGALEPDQRATVVVVAVVNSQTPGGAILDNDTQTYSSTYDPANGDNYAAQRTTVDAWADLTITKLADPALALPGETLTYTLTVRNLGPGDASGASVEDILPAGVADATWTCAAQNGAACAAHGIGSLAETIDLPVGGVLVYTLQGTVGGAAVFTNTATVTVPLSTPDPYPLDNRASVANRPQVVYLPLIASEQNVSGPDLVVEELIVGSYGVQVVIRNQGTAPAVNGFWVDVYINPRVAPRAVNQVWADLADQGLTWGVNAAALPLQPGDTLVLSVNDRYYWPSLSRVAWPLPGGAPLYAQADSYAPTSAYGLVEENHESTGETYNNISGPVLAPVTALSVFPAQVAPSIPRLRPLLRR